MDGTLRTTGLVNGLFHAWRAPILQVPASFQTIPETFQLVGSQSIAIHRDTGCSFSIPLLSTPCPALYPDPQVGELRQGQALPEPPHLGARMKSQKGPEDHPESLTESSMYIGGNGSQEERREKLSSQQGFNGAGVETRGPDSYPGPLDCYIGR